jgi:hypothetical protein
MALNPEWREFVELLDTISAEYMAERTVDHAVTKGPA